MNRAGKYINALGGIANYKAYKPNSLPPFPENNFILQLEQCT